MKQTMCEVLNKNVEVYISIETTTENGHCVQSKQKDQISQQLTPIQCQLHVFTSQVALYRSVYTHGRPCV